MADYASDVAEVISGLSKLFRKQHTEPYLAVGALAFLLHQTLGFLRDTAPPEMQEKFDDSELPELCRRLEHVMFVFQVAGDAERGMPAMPRTTQ